MNGSRCHPSPRRSPGRSTFARPDDDTSPTSARTSARSASRTSASMLVVSLLNIRYHTPKCLINSTSKACFSGGRAESAGCSKRGDAIAGARPLEAAEREAFQAVVGRGGRFYAGGSGVPCGLDLAGIARLGLGCAAGCRARGRFGAGRGPDARGWRPERPLFAISHNGLVEHRACRASDLVGRVDTDGRDPALARVRNFGEPERPRRVVLSGVYGRHTGPCWPRTPRRGERPD